jgi:hypothetical protein
MDRDIILDYLNRIEGLLETISDEDLAEIFNNNKTSTEVLDYFERIERLLFR